MLFIVIYMILIALVLEVSSTLLIISGLKKEIARFQAVSMLTATGFTTLESELILRHPIRRNIGVFLILFGVFSLAVLISIISNLMGQNLRIPALTVVTIGLAIIWLSIKNKKIMSLLKRKFHRHLNQQFELHQLPIEEILYTSDTDWIKDVHIHADSKLIDQRTDTLFGQEEDILMLFVQRDDQKIRHQCLKLTIQEGDILFVYGSKLAIGEKFHHELVSMKLSDQKEQHVVSM
ncbi:hypothetical protein [Paenibacillus sp. 1_12]|uniref:hypothetical protein n=1 Tax=Paenibacillus sp. 1_12 TaxID=1566278 RepID=UPI002109CA57|nr:hypothetical protein [Paenibacillus sp. 1_12]